jgi:hypothetical protein
VRGLEIGLAISRRRDAMTARIDHVFSRQRKCLDRMANASEIVNVGNDQLEIYFYVMLSLYYGERLS